MPYHRGNDQHKKFLKRKIKPTKVSMVNFLNETSEAIIRNNHYIEEIAFMGSKVTGATCTWREFVNLANFDYNNTDNVRHVAYDFMITFTNGDQLVRHKGECEGWCFLLAPKANPTARKLTNLCTGAKEATYQ